MGARHREPAVDRRPDVLDLAPEEPELTHLTLDVARAGPDPPHEEADRTDEQQGQHAPDAYAGPPDAVKRPCIDSGHVPW